MTSTNAAEVAVFLAQRPYESAYLEWLVRSGAVTNLEHPVCYLSRAAGGTIDGVCYFGAQFIPVTQSEEALQKFGEIARTAPPARMIVGSREAVQRWQEILGGAYREPRAIRARQPLYALTRATLRGSRADADVGIAKAAELDEIARESAAMIEHEVGIDPGAANHGFRERTAHTIRSGWWWRWRVEGTLRFQCSVGAQTPATTQVQGVWTPPAQRGKGYATRALGATCDHLLDRSPSLCLYVNDFNTAAIALYERLGFEPVGEFMTLLF